MTRSVEFVFDVASPTTYLAWTQLPAICERHGAELIWTPVLLGGLFKLAENSSPILVTPKRNWMFHDIQRYANRYTVPFQLNSHFPINTLPLMRGAVAMQREGRLEAYLDAIFPAMWVNDLNMGDPEVIGGVLMEAGFDPQDFVEKIQTPEVKQELIENTSSAYKRGAFGCPTFFVGDEMHFGQDRLDFVEAALS